MDLQRTLFNNHPHITYAGLSGILAIFSLGPTPGMIPIILNLSLLLVYSRILFPTYAQHTVRRTATLWTFLTVGGSIPRLTASIHALSQPSVSIISLFLLSGVTSILSIGALQLETRAGSRYKSDTVDLFLFPAIWATFWSTIAYLSPLGILSTWSPVEGTEAYNWLVPFFGQEFLNWVAAAWAVVISQTLMSFYMGSKDDEDSYPGPLIPTDPLNGHHHGVGNEASDVRSSVTGKNKTALLAVGLVLLTVPSYIINSLPLPIDDVDKVTPLVVGCALPKFDIYKHHEPVFDDFLEESKKLDSAANFILWPEGAVRFHSEAERNDALAEVREKVRHAYVGVAFEETLDDPKDPGNRQGIRRTGVAIVSNKTTTPHLLYYKRHLVPIAESFSLARSHDLPTTFAAKVKSKLFTTHDHIRELPVTSSICLDFSDPSLFEGLDVKPGLILAPARTWDVTVGYTMWKQASQRAREVGSALLWCDGGEGGVSGVAGHGHNEVLQVGSGSWVRTIGLEYPFDENKRTWYARYGSTVLLLFWALVVGSPLRQHGGSLVHNLVVGRFRRRAAVPSPPVGNLLDV